MKNGGCNEVGMGYAVLALRRMLFDAETILAVVAEMKNAFEDTSPDAAVKALHEIKGDKHEHMADA